MVQVFKPSGKKIKIKRDDEQTKIFLKTCQPMDLEKVIEKAESIFKDEVIYLKINKA